jgi:hypothetical protein
MQTPEELRALAKNGPAEIAVRELKARRPRVDAVVHLLDTYYASSLRQTHGAGPRDHS